MIGGIELPNFKYTYTIQEKDKAYYDKCSIGQSVTDPGLKIGSLLRDGDFSKLKVKITGKRTEKRK